MLQDLVTFRALGLRPAVTTKKRVSATAWTRPCGARPGPGSAAERLAPSRQASPGVSALSITEKLGFFPPSQWVALRRWGRVPQNCFVTYEGAA